MLEKIKEVIEMNDSLVVFKGGKEHCILPEHYEQLAIEIHNILKADNVELPLIKAISDTHS